MHYFYVTPMLCTICMKRHRGYNANKIVPVTNIVNSMYLSESVAAERMRTVPSTKCIRNISNCVRQVTSIVAKQFTCVSRIDLIRANLCVLLHIYRLTLRAHISVVTT